MRGLTFAEDRHIQQAVGNYVPFYSNARLHSFLHHVPPATLNGLLNGLLEEPGVNKIGRDSARQALVALAGARHRELYAR